MLSEKETEALHSLLAETGFSSEPGPRVQMAGDGSDRRFYRFAIDDLSLLAILPRSNSDKGMAEARAAWAIGRHLLARGVAVPRLYGFTEACGLILCEDLGDLKLHDLVLRLGPEAPEVEACYRQALAALAQLQTAARPGFDPGWCWDTPRYDRALMLARESGYFRKALCEDFLGMNDLPQELEREFLLLAERAAAEPADFILHRDFQSRNLMVRDGQIRIIDFQGARLGPLGYDPASLLIDPYAGLPARLRQTLLDSYLDDLAAHLPLDRGRFMEGYYYLVMQRDLQILGAFAFLSQRRGKSFFQQFIGPAADALHEHLSAPQGRAFPCLRAVAAQVQESFKHQHGNEETPCKPDTP